MEGRWGVYDYSRASALLFTVSANQDESQEFLSHLIGESLQKSDEKSTCFQPRSAPEGHQPKQPKLQVQEMHFALKDFPALFADETEGLPRPNAVVRLCRSAQGHGRGFSVTAAQLTVKAATPAGSAEPPGEAPALSRAPFGHGWDHQRSLLARLLLGRSCLFLNSS